MKNIREFNAFKSIKSRLETSLYLAQKSLIQKIDGANELAAKVLELIPELQIKDLLRLPAEDGLKKDRYSILAYDPNVCLLATMILIGIEQSQNPNDDRVLSSLVCIQKVDADAIGYTQGNSSKWRNTFEEVSKLTNGFISMESYNQTTNINETSISFACDFKKDLPQKVEA